jgi:hypothetical protein
VELGRAVLIKIDVGQGGETIILHLLTSLLENRTRANRNRNNTTVFNEAIPFVQQLIAWLGPALEDDDNLRDAVASNNVPPESMPHATTPNETEHYDGDVVIDPALRLLQAE